MRVGIPNPEKLLKWRKALFDLEGVTLRNRQRAQLFGDHLGVVRNEPSQFSMKENSLL